MSGHQQTSRYTLSGKLHYIVVSLAKEIGLVLGEPGECFLLVVSVVMENVGVLAVIYWPAVARSLEAH